MNGKKDDNVDDYIVKNHLEVFLGRVATDKEFYIFNFLMQGCSYNDIRYMVACSKQSGRRWFEILLDKILEVIERVS
ncbi:hypothetical protein [Staphylococcus schweitzeri]|uniref:hypothetical protein n=1 Tax=Staphylococcus schweitzeri TaxID=1654388 RepID=UPI0005081FC9|nr:hypothetical protein [Staphylococcus schweitzeri]CDR66701.1 pathogenicity island protein ORF6 [Staphylococcus schweitzeri]